MPRVCFFTSTHYPFDFRIFHKECKSLVRAGYEVTLVALHDRDETVDGVRIIGLPRPKGRLSRMTRTAWMAYRLAAKQNAFVYHFHDPELIFAGLLFTLQGKKVIRDVREDLPRQLLDKHYLPGWSKTILAFMAEWLEDFSAHLLSAVIAATPGIASRFQKHNRQTVLVRNFPSLAEMPLEQIHRRDRRENWIIYVGSISARRGIRQLVEAMALLPGDPQARLKLAGEFSPVSLLEDVRQMAGWAQVDYLGRLERADILRLLPQGRVGVLTLENTPHIRSSWPVKLFEYMLAGLPVVASDIALWREMIEDAGCGILVDSANPHAIAEAIDYLLMHPLEADCMGRRGREAVEKSYSWVTEEDRLLELYRNIAGCPVLSEAANAHAAKTHTSAALEHVEP